MTSTMSMPAMESSSGLAICDSTTSAEAPTYLTVTVTTGSSILGYSRTGSLVNDTAPISNTNSESTVANTGRRIEISGNCMAASYQELALKLKQGLAPVLAAAGDLAGNLAALG